mgnify:CR=1 FL=1
MPEEKEEDIGQDIALPRQVCGKTLFYETGIYKRLLDRRTLLLPVEKRIFRGRGNYG